MAQKKISWKLPWDAMVFLSLGIVFEIVAVLQRFFVENLLWNAVTGMVASLILFYGGMRFIYTIKLGKRTVFWVVLAGCLYFAFRIVDVVETMHRDFFARLLRVDQYFDGSINFEAVLRDVFAISAAMALFVGVSQALYLSYKSRQLLIERNEALDREVREHKAAEARARMSQDTLSVLINALSAAVFLIDRDGRIATHNRYFAEMLGDGQGDMCGRTLDEVMPTPLYDRDAQQALARDENHTPQAFPKRFKGRTYDVKAHPVLDSHGAVSKVAVLAQDITERLTDEQARALRDTAITCAAEAVMITDAAGKIIHVNPAFEEMTGFTAAEAEGRTPALLRSGHHDPEFYRKLWDTISGGSVWRGEFLNRHKSGETFREQATISPIIAEGGHITHYVAVKRDITRERELERQIQQAQKMDIIGTLAGGISHDFNNVLAIIMGHSELVLQHLGADHPARKSLESIARTAARASKLTKRLLAFSRQNPDEAGPMAAAPTIQEQVNIVRVYIPSNIKIEARIGDDVGYIYGEPSEVQQVLVNLCTNASHAMQPDGGDLMVSLEAIALDAILHVASGDALAPGNYIRLRVRDTGCGMDDSTRQRIFEPFYTTKAPGAGTGLGLSMVYGSVTRVNGGVDVVSTAGQGAQFDVYWPRIEYTAPPDDVCAENKPSGEGRSVLLVDDMEDFGALTELNLVNYGFRVKAFADPREAVVFFKDHGAEVDAVITDYMMPEMNGADLAKHIHRIRPELPIILLSGYASGITAEKAREYGISLVLRKPTSSDALARQLIELTPQGRNEIC